VPLGWVRCKCQISNAIWYLLYVRVRHLEPSRSEIGNWGSFRIFWE